VVGRGNHLQKVFRGDEDCGVFLETVGEVCGRTGWKVHAYALMGNHYHMLLETPEPNLVVGMQWVQSTYTKRFNAVHRVWGHLFSGRYKAIPVEASRNYFLCIADYIHLNPVRVKGYDFETSELMDYAWSSYPGYVFKRKRPLWLCVERVMGELGLEDTRSGRQQFMAHMQRRILGVRHAKNPWSADEQWPQIRRGWHFGGKSFKSEMLERLTDVLNQDTGTPFGGDIIQEHDEHRAEKLIQTGIGELGIRDDDLSAMPGCCPEKYALAWLVRRKTSVKVTWIKERLHMGRATDFSAWIKKLETSRAGEWGNAARLRVKDINS